MIIRHTTAHRLILIGDEVLTKKLGALIQTLAPIHITTEINEYTDLYLATQYPKKEEISEDVDFSIRIIKKGFRLFFQPDAVVEHMHRVTLEAYCKQLFGYGFGHPLSVQVHAKKIFEICLQYFGYIYIPVPCFIKGVVYIGNFHLMHIFGALFLIRLFLALFNPGLFNGWILFFGLLSLVFGILYFLPALKLNPKSKFLAWAKIRYLSNWALMRGGFKGMKEWRVFYIESSW